MGNQIVALNDKSFAEQVENTEDAVLVDFWAEWCMPCRALAPVIDELSHEFHGKVRFAKLNVDESKDIPAKYGIRGIPTLILFQNGKKINELVGNQPKEKIRAMLTKVVSEK